MATKRDECLLDLNVDPSELCVFSDNEDSSTPHVSSSNNLLLDLNNEPPKEDEPPQEDDMHLLFDLNSDPPQEDMHMEEEDMHAEIGSIVLADTNDEESVNDNDQDEQLPQAHDHKRRKGKNLPNDQRRVIYDMLLQKSTDGKLKRGVTRIVASEFSVSIKIVRSIWNRAKDCVFHVDVSHKMPKIGRKRIELDLAQIRNVPLHQRTSLSSLYHALNASKTTLFRRLKSGAIRRHTNGIKPFLKEENKKARLQFCLSMLDPTSIPHNPIFVGMHNIIHIDEKWFYMTMKSEKYYLLPDEEDPIRTCKSKKFIVKVMFLAALARPRFDAQGNVSFSGKIGVFPFITKEPAKRSSVNRAAGTLETKPIISVKREIIRSFLIDKVLPAIKEKWPREDLRHPIFIQQDNARTHIDQNDVEFRQAALKDGFDIRLMCQPANSPDLNILDLGFFNAIQSLQHKESPKTVDELVNAVVKAFEEFTSIKSNHIFLTLQLCMMEIMKAKGAHKYKIPHMSKAMLERKGQLPVQIKCASTLVQEVRNSLS